MTNKKTILHIIQNFGIGGAETAVIGVLKNLSEYNNIVVTLDSLNQFGSELKYDKYYCLNLKSYYLFPFAIGKLRKIIKDNKVDIVHSQLYWSNVLARFACPADVPLVTTIQSSITDTVEYKKKWIIWLDKISYRWKKSTLLGVSKYALNDYYDFLKLKRHDNHILYNFVDTDVFALPADSVKKESDDFKLIAVGNLKPQKNFIFLLQAFTQLKNLGISLDIYGDGMFQSDFEKFIEDNQLPVRLMGKIRNLPEVMKDYDLFIMSSFYEGFSLAVLEGMAMQKPMLLSDIPTFTEQCADTAVYFSLDDTADVIEKIKMLRNDRAKLADLAARGRQRVLNNFTLNHHLVTLRKIYNLVLHKK